MEVTRVDQRSYIKVVLRGKNAMKNHSDLVEALGNNVLPYRAVARWLMLMPPGRQWQINVHEIHRGKRLVFMPVVRYIFEHHVRLCLVPPQF
ncbi:hypothetical protein TNCV_3714171 [Trichonephila clavipes]|nr:hypothetical protein TNCV_3714171 [Trichonephila clavipes]